MPRARVSVGCVLRSGASDRPPLRTQRMSTMECDVMTVPVTTKQHLHAADVLLAALSSLNRIDGPYAFDNTWKVSEGVEDELSPYSHVRAAALQACTALCHGNAERASQLLAAALDSGDDHIGDALARLRQDVWSVERRDVIVEVVDQLYDAAGEDTDTLNALVVAAGLMWVCASCQSRNPLDVDECDICGRPQTSSDSPDLDSSSR